MAVLAVSSDTRSDSGNELLRLNRALRVVSLCNQALLRATDEKALVAEICRILCEQAGYVQATVGYVEGDEGRTVRVVSRAGSKLNLLTKPGQVWTDPGGDKTSASKALRTGRASLRDLACDPGDETLRAQALKAGLRFTIALPLKEDETARPFGLLSLYSSDSRLHSQEEISLLEELAGDLSFGILAMRMRAAYRHAEDDRRAHLRFLEGLDRVGRAIQATADPEQMMSEVLDTVLAIFDCDRAYLAYPCDPQAASWEVPVERTRPDYPGAHALGVPVSMTPEIAQACARLLTSELPLRFGVNGEHKVPAATSKQFHVQSYMCMAIRPKVGKPWHFGIHQCTNARIWTDNERQLLNEIGRRIADGLTNLLSQRDLREKESRLRTLIQTIPDMVWLKDPNGVYLDCNAEMARLHGLSEAEIIGKTDYDFTDREVADGFLAQDRKAMEVGAPVVNQEWGSFRGMAAPTLFETVKTPMWGSSGKLVGVLGIARDITARYQADEQLRIAAAAFETQEGIMVTDSNFIVLRVNHAFTDISGFAGEEIVGQWMGVLRSERDDDRFYWEIWEQISRDGSWQGEVWGRRKDSADYPQWLAVTSVRNEKGATTHFVCSFFDITARKAAEAEIEYLAYHDPLTALPNRRLLLDRLQQALAGSARGHCRGALLFIDLDNFKTVNDTNGHEAGDRLLVEVAGRLASGAEKGDTIARIGGDEFVVMLEDLPENPTDAAAQAKRSGESIRLSLAEPYEINERSYLCTASIGIVLFHGTGESVDELLKQADIAMYQAKSSGRDSLCFFDPQMQAQLAARAQLEAALRVALQEQQFVLYYQAQVDSARGIVGAEALLRWQRPEHGLVLPSEFISIAEETSLILPLGHWVLRTACQQLAAWSRNPRTWHLNLSINVSARQFRQADFVSQVHEILKTTGAPPAHLKLELTESLVLHDVPDTIQKMQALRQLGVGCAMDDFGTGYSSLAYLTQLPLDQLKIDQSFVRNLPDTASDAVVVQTIITLARSLGLVVIAEGVETEAQRQFLERHGCPLWQGFLFGKGMGPQAFEKLLSTT